MSYRKAISDLLIATAAGGTFPTVTYSGTPQVVTEGASLAPRSVEANEVQAGFGIDDRYGRSLKVDRQSWTWQMILRFDAEVSLQEFEDSLNEDPPCIQQDPSDDRPHTVRLILTRAQYVHPPRISPSNGTEVKYTLDVLLSPL